jgi:hypothetical protein
MQRAVPTYLSRIALSEGRLTLDTLVPAKMEYYETLCGPKPRTFSVDDYLAGELTRFRQTLIDKDPVSGLQMCLAMALRDDISCVGLWSGTTDELWSALARIDYRSDPFSIVGALDLALTYSNDSRFSELADRLIHHLCQHALDREDGIDVYAFYPALIDMVDSAVALVPGMRGQPPFWRCLCSWTHAATVSRVLRPVPLNASEFSTWCAEQTTEYAKLATLLDIRQTPALLPGNTSAYKLKAEVLGRVAVLRTRYTDTGWPLSGTAILDEALETLATDGIPGSYVLPGPLEGDRRPQQLISNLPEEAARGFTCRIAGLASGLSDPAWEQLSYFSRFYRLGAEARQTAVAALQVTKAGTDPAERERSFSVLAGVGFIALVQDWPELAEGVLALCLRECSSETVLSEAAMIVRIALIAVAALPPDDAALKFGEFLLDASASLSSPAREIIHDEILALKYLTPAEPWSLSQQEAFSAS